MAKVSGCPKCLVGVPGIMADPMFACDECDGTGVPRAHVFVCLGSDYEGDWITGVFDSRDKAEAHLSAHSGDHNEIRPTRIEEYIVNKDDLAGLV